MKSSCSSSPMPSKMQATTALHRARLDAAEQARLGALPANERADAITFLQDLMNVRPQVWNAQVELREEFLAGVDARSDERVVAAEGRMQILVVRSEIALRVEEATRMDEGSSGCGSQLSSSLLDEKEGQLGMHSPMRIDPDQGRQ